MKNASIHLENDMSLLLGRAEVTPAHCQCQADTPILECLQCKSSTSSMMSCQEYAQTEELLLSLTPHTQGVQCCVFWVAISLTCHFTTWKWPWAASHRGVVCQTLLIDKTLYLKTLPISFTLPSSSTIKLLTSFTLRCSLACSPWLPRVSLLCVSRHVVPFCDPKN